MTKKSQFPRGEEEIRANELIKVTQREARANKDHLKDIQVTGKNSRAFHGEGQAHSLPKGLWWGIAGLVVLFVAGFAVSFYIIKGKVAGSISNRIDTIQQGVRDLQNLDPQSAAEEFSSVSTADVSDLGSLANVLGFLFRGSSDAFRAVTDISGKLASLSGELANTENSTFDFLSSGKGSDLVTRLNVVKGLLSTIDDDMSRISTAVSSLGGLSPLSGDAYVPLKAQIASAENFLDAFVPWLSNPEPHHVLILLENPSEMRPGGGFLGSYADATIAGGDITNIAVHDIADADKGFKKNIVPPIPLQLEGPRFRPADGNWFFDFPTSASETVSLFASSSVASGTIFDSVIALTPNVISDLLSITGPVTIKQGKASTTFTADNATVEIQKIVQAGQATAATYPKAVLTDLSSAIFGKLTVAITASSTASSTTPDDVRQQLLSNILKWAAKKDVTVYFKDPALESAADNYGVSGAAYELPQNFNGDYLAIANADINSDKSELYIKQDINLDAVINDDGTETDHLMITRTHTGNKSPYWWYKTTNLDYLQIFVPQGSSVENTSGGTKKSITPPANYIKEKYLVDPLIFDIESSTRTFFDYPTVSYHSESGKQVFTTWAMVRAGASTKLSFDYSHRLFGLPIDGQKYQFIFEKQAGASGHYHFEVNAPIGFTFLENNLPSYSYDSDDVPGRVIINLTLIKI